MNSIIAGHKNLNKVIPILFVFITFPSIGQWLNVKIGNTTIWWFIETIFLLATYIYIFTYYTATFYKWKRQRDKLLISLYLSAKQKNKKTFTLSYLLYKQNAINKIQKIKFPIPIIIYILYIIFAIIYGGFKASNYWDFKILYSNSMIFLLPVICFFFSIPDNIKRTCRTWVSFAIIAFWPLLPIMQMECPARFLFPFAFFILFWPYYNKKGIIICGIAFICVFVFGSLGARSSAIRFLASLSFSLLILLRNYIPKLIYVISSSFMIIIPIVLLWLGISGQFNIFKIGEYLDINVKVDNSMVDGASENLSTDTRTFLYVETITSAVGHDYWLLGNSLSQGYYSDFFTDTDEVEGRGMRYSTEVGILNVFTGLGVVGVIIYLSIFVYTLINVFINSNNKSLYALAVLLSFRWLFSFLEEFTYFDLNMAFLWIEIAICNSPHFLRMTDAQFKNWMKNLIIA